MRLPSCGPGFESQAHHLRTLFPFIVKFCVIFFSVGGQLLIKSCERLFTNRLNNKPTTLSLNWLFKILFRALVYWLWEETYVEKFRRGCWFKANCHRSHPEFQSQRREFKQNKRRDQEKTNWTSKYVEFLTYKYWT